MSSSRSVLTQVGEAVAALQSLDPTALTEVEQRELLHALEPLTSALAAVSGHVLAAFEAQGGPEAECAASTGSWLRREFRLDPADAAARVRAARVLRDLPDTAAALAAGEIHSGHVRVLARAATKVGEDVLAEAEPVLLELARKARPHDVQVAVDRLALAVDADQDRDAAAARQLEGRFLRVTPGFAGGFDVSGFLDEAGGRILLAMFSGFARKSPSEQGVPDTRTRVQRQADTLVEAAQLMLDAGKQTRVGKLPVAVTLVTDLETLKGDAPRWAAGSMLSSLFRHGFGQGTLERLTCCADVTPAVVTGQGVPLALGRTERCATAHQMKALWIRDGGCVNPGCDNARLEAHHIVWWVNGGRTDVEEMALVCSRCHTLLHEYGWALEHDPQRPGLLRWRPPDGRPPIPACHTIDRDPGSKLPLE